MVPGEALEHADAICIGPAEGVWLAVVEDAERDWKLAEARAHRAAARAAARASSCACTKEVVSA